MQGLIFAFSPLPLNLLLMGLAKSSLPQGAHGGSGQSGSERDKRLPPSFILLVDPRGHEESPVPSLLSMEHEE